MNFLNEVGRVGRQYRDYVNTNVESFQQLSPLNIKRAFFVSMTLLLSMGAGAAGGIFMHDNQNSQAGMAAGVIGSIAILSLCVCVCTWSPEDQQPVPLVFPQLPVIDGDEPVEQPVP